MQLQKVVQLSIFFYTIIKSTKTTLIGEYCKTRYLRLAQNNNYAKYNFFWVLVISVKTNNYMKHDFFFLLAFAAKKHFSCLQRKMITCVYSKNTFLLFG